MFRGESQVNLGELTQNSKRPLLGELSSVEAVSSLKQCILPSWAHKKLLHCLFSSRPEQSLDTLQWAKGAELRLALIAGKLQPADSLYGAA